MTRQRPEERSSFAAGLELLLTGDTYHWSQRSKVWRDGWRNLHELQAALTAESALEGRVRLEAKTATRPYRREGNPASAGPSSRGGFPAHEPLPR